jgi:hypothetical protein
MSNATASMESNILIALANTSHTTRLTISRCDGVPAAIIDALFHPSGVWAIREYLKEIGEYESQLLPQGEQTKEAR